MVKEQFSLNCRRGIVTGASRGLGMAMASGLTEMGVDLVIAARNLEKLETVAEDLSVYGGKIVPVRTDVSVDEYLNVLVEKNLH